MQTFSLSEAATFNDGRHRDFVSGHNLVPRYG